MIALCSKGAQLQALPRALAASKAGKGSRGADGPCDVLKQRMRPAPEQSRELALPEAVWLQPGHGEMASSAAHEWLAFK